MELERLFLRKDVGSLFDIYKLSNTKVTGKKLKNRTNLRVSIIRPKRDSIERKIRGKKILKKMYIFHSWAPITLCGSRRIPVSKVKVIYYFSFICLI